MQIPIGNRIYDVIGEYGAFYLCTYKNLYRTCFLKRDVENDDLNDDYRVAKHIEYYDKRSKLNKQGKHAGKKINGQYFRI